MKVYHQSVFDRWPFEDNSVQAIITSPPYWGLRKYDIPDVEIDGWKGQYGLEPSYKDYIEHTVLWAKEAWRVLKDDGVMMVNLGDSYASSSIQHETIYDKNDIIPQGCPLRDSFLNRPCDGCQAVSALRNFHKDAFVLPVSSSDLRDPILVRKESVNDHVPTLDSLNQKQIHQSFSSNQDLTHLQDHEGGQFLSLQESTPSVFSQQSQDDNLQKDNVSSSPSSEQKQLDTIREFVDKKVYSSVFVSSEANQDHGVHMPYTSLIDGAYTFHKKGKVYDSCPYQHSNITKHHKSTIKPKCKMLIPHRTAIALIDSMVDGWVLRNDIIWKKIPYMPESVKDRFTKCYENIFFFVKSQKYFFDHDPIREPLKMNRWSKSNKLGSSNKDTKTGGGAPGQSPHSWERKGHSGYFDGDGNPLFNPKGRQACDVWEINIQPSPEKHFAMWPEKLVERMIRCSTKPGDTVLDPFAGSGTTLRVAERLNRIGYGIDLGYQDIQARRLNEIQKELL